MTNYLLKSKLNEIFKDEKNRRKKIAKQEKIRLENKDY